MNLTFAITRTGIVLLSTLLILVACDTAPTDLLPSVNDGTDGNGTGGNGTGGDAIQPFGFSIQVARHVDQTFSEERIDDIFAQASSILQSVETDCPDVACPVTFTRDGLVEAFDIASNVITSEAQLDAVFDHPADIKIVTLMVGVCGSPSPSDMSVILGCAFTSGSVVIAHNAPADVWAHEWGHLQGLPHRNDCETNLMHAFELETNAVDATERDAFLNPTPNQGFFRMAPLQHDEPVNYRMRMGDESLPDWLDRIVSRRYLTGLPPATFVSEGNQQIVAGLLEMLDRRSADMHRVNIVRGLGLAGDPQVCTNLIGLIDGLKGELTTDDIAVAAETFLALGRLAGDDPSGAAIAYLIEGTSSESWSDQGLSLGDGKHSASALNEVFARFCVMGLGLADHPLAQAHLSELRAQINADRRSGEWFAEQVDEALARSPQISSGATRQQGASLRTP